MQRRAFVLLQLEAACNTFNFALDCTDISLRLFIYLFIYLSPSWRLYLHHTSCAVALLVLAMRTAAVDVLGCRVPRLSQTGTSLVAVHYISWQ
jgi:hypothetical protein